MTKKATSLMILGVFTSIFLFSGILKIFNIPTYDQILQSVLGDPNAITTSIAILMTVIFILFIVFLILKINHSTKAVE